MCPFPDEILQNRPLQERCFLLRDGRVVIETACLASAEELLQYQWDALIEHRLATRETFTDLALRLPESGFFLLVPPAPVASPYINWPALMHKIEVNEEPGVVGYGIADGVPLSREHFSPCILTSVEDGDAWREFDPRKAAERAKKMGRVPLNVWQAYILCLLFPSILERHGIYATYARHENAFVSFELRDDGTPLLSTPSATDRGYIRANHGLATYERALRHAPVPQTA